MNAAIEDMVKTVKIAKATKAFGNCVEVYGSKEAALRSLDCKSADEAIEMLSVVQSVKIWKSNGKVVVD